jgi:hypothetical protein
MKKMYYTDRNISMAKEAAVLKHMGGYVNFDINNSEVYCYAVQTDK